MAQRATATTNTTTPRPTLSELARQATSNQQTGEQQLSPLPPLRPQQSTPCLTCTISGGNPNRSQPNCRHPREVSGQRCNAIPPPPSEPCYPYSTLVAPRHSCVEDSGTSDTSDRVERTPPNNSSVATESRRTENTSGSSDTSPENI